jgi:hypothetical protein
MVFCNCRTIRPINPDDIVMNLKIEKSFLAGKVAKVKTHKPAPPPPPDSGSSGSIGIEVNFNISSDDAEVILIIVTVIIIAAAGWHFGTCRVYMMPAGYPEYKQQLYWGENRIFLPRAAEEKGILLYFSTFGRIKKEWTYKFVPGENKRLMLKGDKIIEVKAKTEDEFREMISQPEE